MADGQTVISRELPVYIERFFGHRFSNPSFPWGLHLSGLAAFSEMGKGSHFPHNLLLPLRRTARELWRALAEHPYANLKIMKPLLKRLQNQDPSTEAFGRRNSQSIMPIAVSPPPAARMGGTPKGRGEGGSGQTGGGAEIGASFGGSPPSL